MVTAIHENIQNIVLIGPALGYGVSLLISWFEKSKPATITNALPNINYVKAVARLKIEQPGSKPAFTAKQLQASGHTDYGSMLSLLRNPTQETARKIK